MGDVDQVTDETRKVLRHLQASVCDAIDTGVSPELVLDAVAAGLQRATLENRGFGSTPLAMSLTRAFNSSVGSNPETGPTEVPTPSPARS